MPQIGRVPGRSAISWTTKQLHLTAVPGLDDTPARLDISEIAAALPHGPVEPHLRADRTAVRTRERHAQVHTLMAQGHSLRSIGVEY
ncbi:hypothetical protein LTT66_33045 [Nocardia gipuzkoensis]|uniref:hypothetical protein n=1 Tax=Nocardia gipuzkoensis TaxID=2749991 RepID=UPI001E53F6B2|nr:hypothetical protein [Nocardia gipuzkoensis]UGT67947.1 hypothetical protein LTT66_33045 [Nocardia gipuzkoensis]